MLPERTRGFIEKLQRPPALQAAERDPVHILGTGLGRVRPLGTELQSPSTSFAARLVDAIESTEPFLRRYTACTVWSALRLCSSLTPLNRAKTQAGANLTITLDI